MEIDKVVETLTQLHARIEIEKLWQDGDKLSQMIVKLSGLVAFMGDHIAEAELNAKELETAYKYDRDKKFLELKEQKYADEKAKAQSGIETAPKYHEFLLAQDKARILNLKRMDTNNMIDAMRSRLSFMKSEMVNA